MADYRKKTKQVKQEHEPNPKKAVTVYDPINYYDKNPTWVFNTRDTELWSITDHVLWDELLPFMQQLEKQTWGEILSINNNGNKHHSILVGDLTKKAQKRLVEKFVEAESILSLRITGTHRLYGYIFGANSAFNILWYDDNHGNNDECVCRSHLKHT